MAKPKITIKEAKLIKGIAEGKTQRQAYIDAYDTKGKIETVDVEASKTIRKPQVQEALAIALNKYNITPDRTLKRVSEALDAEKVSIVGNGDQSMAEITPDHATRLAAVKIAHNLMGVGNKDNNGNTYNFNQVQVIHKDKYDL
jgi:uncharacterized membrane protein